MVGMRPQLIRFFQFLSFTVCYEFKAKCSLSNTALNEDIEVEEVKGGWRRESRVEEEEVEEVEEEEEDEKEEE